MRRYLPVSASVVAVLSLIAMPAAHAQLSGGIHAQMPTPSTASPPIRAPRLTPIPQRPASPLPPESPVTALAPSSAEHALMPEPTVIPPPIVMVPPNLLPLSQIPPGLNPDITTPVVPVPAGTPLLPHP